MVRVKGNQHGAGGIDRRVCRGGTWGAAGGDPGKKAGVIERRRIWTDALLADYIRDELGFPGARPMVDVDIATGEVSRERWYLLTSLGSRQWGPRELLRLFRNHWSVENSLHHVKDRSWDEDVHTDIRHPRQHRSDAPGGASQDLRLPPNVARLYENGCNRPGIKGGYNLPRNPINTSGP